MGNSVPQQARLENDGRAFTPFQWFFNKEVIGSLLLLLASLGAVLIANSTLYGWYEHLLHMDVTLHVDRLRISRSLLHWVNDGLMTLFFFTVGLEIKREVMVGELASPKQALLPVIAAAGGMLMPGLIYLAFNAGGPGVHGWGIPVATDIAFSLGAIAILGRKLPVGLRIFLTAFAIADDLGAVVIIALFYTQGITTVYLQASGVCVLILLMGNLLWLRWIPFYLVMGVATWICVMGSGVHATVAGVVVAMLVPARGKYNTIRFVNEAQAIISGMTTDRRIDAAWYSIFLRPDHQNAVHALELALHNVETPLQRLEHALHPWVVYLVLPVFAFFNAGLPLQAMSLAEAAANPIALGCTLGLLLGKPLGVSLAAYAAVRMGVAALPENVRWPHIVGAGMLGGIGFTMSLFISGLSFTDVMFLNYSKLGVLAGSVLSAAAGLGFLAVVAARDGRTYAEAAGETS
jgi:NhaA family Na+:H+ antiporter